MTSTTTTSARTAELFPFVNQQRKEVAAAAASSLLESSSYMDWAPAPPNTAEQEMITTLDNLTRRLASQDETLSHWEPWLGAFADLLLEHYHVEEAFHRCVQAAHRNTVVHAVTLRCLPERELQLAIQNLPQHTRQLVVEKSSRSQTLPSSAFATVGDHCPRMEKLHVDTRITVRSPTDVHRLASSLDRLSSSLQDISLHILPRCRSFTDPKVDLSPLLENLRDFRSVSLTAGYDHNCYHKPLVTPDALRLFLQNNPHLQKLQLDNFGLRDEHLACWSAKTPQLRTLQLAKHPPHSFTPAALYRLVREQKELESCVVVTPEEYYQRSQNGGEDVLLQDGLYTACLQRGYQRYGCPALFPTVAKALSDYEHISPRCATGTLFAILRADPTIVLQGRGESEKMDLS